MSATRSTRVHTPEHVNAVTGQTAAMSGTVRTRQEIRLTIVGGDARGESNCLDSCGLRTLRAVAARFSHRGFSSTENPFPTRANSPRGEDAKLRIRRWA